MAITAQERVFSFDSGETTARNVIILKRPATTSIAFDFDRKLDSGSTISTAPVTQVDSNTALTIGGSTISNEQVLVSISGWLNEKRYRVRCSATLSSGQIIVVEGWIEVTEL